ncbi:MAG TPA: glucose-6-phosphate dehydrogenase [Vicinamibacterales bacterium]|nr:glucose-6-phosphate dehydrogenase [Vicinamibacterales bacterium]
MSAPGRAMSEHASLDAAPTRTAAPVTLVIFGGAGDLARRKLLPALYNLHLDGVLPPRTAIVAVGRASLTDAGYRSLAKESIAQFARERHTGAPEPDNDGSWTAFAESLFFVGGSLDDSAAYAALGSRLDIIEHERGLPGNRIYYLAVPPSMFVPTVEQLARARFVGAGHRDHSADSPDPRHPRPFARLIVEKPIGRDLASATAINDAIVRVFDERDIYRIDHYLGKETVQNLLVLRFANAIFEPLFNQKYVDHVQITVAESEGVGTRASYYEQAGAMRDMVQNHLLQLLALIAMEPPHSLDPDVVRDEKLEVLLSLRPIEGEAVDAQAVRAQYAAGFEFGAPVRGYLDEPGVAADSRTETFVALRLFVDNWRWAGVPFLLRTGKRLPKRASEITVQLKDVPPILFNRDPAAPLDANALTIRIQPDEGFALGISSKIPGPRVNIYPVKMDFRYSSTFGAGSPEAYERLLLDVMSGDPTLFMRRDEVEAAWRWVSPILERWSGHADRLPTYAAGEWGPDQADALLRPTGRRWRAL